MNPWYGDLIYFHIKLSKLVRMGQNEIPKHTWLRKCTKLGKSVGRGLDGKTRWLSVASPSASHGDNCRSLMKQCKKACSTGLYSTGWVARYSRSVWHGPNNMTFYLGDKTSFNTLGDFSGGWVLLDQVRTTTTSQYYDSSREECHSGVGSLIFQWTVESSFLDTP